MAWFNNDSDRIDLLERKIAHQQAIIEALVRHLGLSLDSFDPYGITEEERQLVYDGKKIQAIKSYRGRTGAGLKEAKDIIETLEN